MKRVICLLACILPIVVFAQQPGFKSSTSDNYWTNVGNSGFSELAANYISLAVSPSGQPFVAYMDYAHSNKATVMKFEGTHWVNFGPTGLTANAAVWNSLAFSPSGELYLAYSDYTNAYKAMVMKFT